MIKTQLDKQYGETNREATKEKRKKYDEIDREYEAEYYINNKETINSKQNQQYVCDCSMLYKHSNKSRHLESQQHRQHLDSLQREETSEQ